jgi:hypothetical protein
MTIGLLLLGALVIFLVVAQRKGWVDFNNKNRPATGIGFGVVEELFAPSRHEARVAQEAKKITPIQILNSDDFSGDIEISFPNEGKS